LPHIYKYTQGKARNTADNSTDVDASD